MRLPAYAARVLEDRRRGVHPPGLAVALGSDWTLPGSRWPMVAIKAEDFTPGRFDWRVATALEVHLLDRRRRLAEFQDIEGFDAILWLAGELAQHGAPLTVFGYLDDPWEISDLAFGYQVPSERLKRHVWPPWWSSRIDGIYARQRQRFYERRAQASGVFSGVAVG